MNGFRLSKKKQTKKFYALYKTATTQSPIPPRPAFFEFRARAKWDAWAATRARVSRAEAEAAYILLAEQKAGWREGLDDSSFSTMPQPQQQQQHPAEHPRNETTTGLAVSTMSDPHPPLCDTQKTIFDWTREGDAMQVFSALDGGDAEQRGIDAVDAQGMGLLHWAADRGHVDIVQGLVQRGVTLDAVDEAGQTALHLGE